MAHLRPGERQSGNLVTSPLEQLAALRAMMGELAEIDSKRTFSHQDGCGSETRVFRVQTARMPLKSSWPGPLHAVVQE
jgi:hypothetical protein